MRWFRKRKTKIVDMGIGVVIPGYDDARKTKIADMGIGGIYTNITINQTKKDKFYDIIFSIEVGSCLEYNRYDLRNGTVWFECDKGYKYKDISDYRDQKLNKLLKDE